MKKDRTFSGSISRKNSVDFARGTIQVKSDSEECVVTSDHELANKVNYTLNVRTLKSLKVWDFTILEEIGRNGNHCYRYSARIKSNTSLNR